MPAGCPLWRAWKHGLCEASCQLKVNGVLTLYCIDGASWLRSRKQHAFCASLAAANASWRALHKLIEAQAEILRLHMSTRQSIRVSRQRFNGCLGPSRSSCALTNASDEPGNRCSTFQTFTRRIDDLARKNDLLQIGPTQLPLLQQNKGRPPVHSRSLLRFVCSSRRTWLAYLLCHRP